MNNNNWLVIAAENINTQNSRILRVCSIPRMGEYIRIYGVGLCLVKRVEYRTFGVDDSCSVLIDNTSLAVTVYYEFDSE